MATPTNTTNTEKRGTPSYGVYDKSPVARAGASWLWMVALAIILIALFFWLF